MSPNLGAPGLSVATALFPLAWAAAFVVAAVAEVVLAADGTSSTAPATSPEQAIDASMSKCARGGMGTTL